MRIIMTLAVHSKATQGWSVINDQLGKHVYRFGQVVESRHVGVLKYLSKDS